MVITDKNDDNKMQDSEKGAQKVEWGGNGGVSVTGRWLCMVLADGNGIAERGRIKDARGTPDRSKAIAMKEDTT